MAICKALSSGKAFPPTTLAKLCMGCHSMLSAAAESLRRLPRDKFERVDHGLLEAAGFWIKFYGALAYRLLSQASFATGSKWGEATALARKSEGMFLQIAPLKW